MPLWLILYLAITYFLGIVLIVLCYTVEGIRDYKMLGSTWLLTVVVLLGVLLLSPVFIPWFLVSFITANVKRYLRRREL